MKIESDEIPGDGWTNLTPAERELEAALASLRPTGAGAAAAAEQPGVGLAFRDRMMFRAGEAAGRAAAAADGAGAGRRLWAWRAAVAALLAVAVGLSWQLADRVGLPAQQVRVVYLPSGGPATDSSRDHGPPRQPQTSQGSQEASRTLTAEEGANRYDPTGESFGASRSLARLAGLAEPRANYLGTRDAVLRWGVRVLPPPIAIAEAAGAGKSLTPRDFPGASAERAARPGPAPDDSSETTLDEMKRLTNWFFPRKDGGRL